MRTIWAVVKVFEGVLDGVSLHVDETAADRDLMAYIGAPVDTTYDDWASMRDSEADPAPWYDDAYDDCRIVVADTGPGVVTSGQSGPRTPLPRRAREGHPH